MDDNRFDAFTRTLGTARSRRGVLKTLGAATLGLTGLAGLGSGASAKANKVGICHGTGSASNPYVYITVSQNAVPAHQAHGDTINPDFSNDINNCGACGAVCPTSGENFTATCTEDTCGEICSPGFHGPDCLAPSIQVSFSADNTGLCNVFVTLSNFAPATDYYVSHSIDDSPQGFFGPYRTDDNGNVGPNYILTFSEGHQISFTVDGVSSGDIPFVCTGE